MCLSLSPSLFIYLYIYLIIYLFIYLFIYLSIYLYMSLFICLLIALPGNGNGNGNGSVRRRENAVCSLGIRNSSLPMQSAVCFVLVEMFYMSRYFHRTNNDH